MTLKNFEKFLFAFFVKTTLTVKFSKLCSKRFSRNTDRRVVLKFREMWPTQNR